MSIASAVVGTPAVASASTNRFFLGAVLYEMRFDAPAGRVTRETGLLPIANRELAARPGSPDFGNFRQPSKGMVLGTKCDHALN